MEPEEPIDEYDERPRHTWRHVRTGVTLLILVIFVVGAAWYSWDIVSPGDDDTTATSDESTSCPTLPVSEAPDAEEIELNIYNSTTRGGLAQDVASQMRDRGFPILEVANDPLEQSIEGPAEVRAGADHEAAASLVAAMVPDAVLVEDDRDSGVVDLVIGDAFDGLADEPDPEETPDGC